MTTKTESRIQAYHWRMLDCRRLGEECALAGLPWQTHQFADLDEQDAYLAGWRESVALLGVERKEIAAAERTLDAAEPQGESFLARMFRKRFGKSRERTEWEKRNG